MTVRENSLRAHDDLDPTPSEAVVLRALEEHGELTREEIAGKTGRPMHTVAARVTGLLKKGLVRETGRHRMTVAGKRAAVLTVARPEFVQMNVFDVEGA